MDLARLTELLHYTPETGVFTWKVSAGKGAVGKIAGHARGSAHAPHYKTIEIGINGRNYRAHRLAWLWIHGVLPESEIDHIDGDGTNNRIDNLRLATHKQNSENIKLRADNRSGRRGVSFHPASGMWRARVSHHGRELCSYHKSPEDAAMAADAARKELFSHYTGRDSA
jgi:hypothetical protein